VEQALNYRQPGVRRGGRKGSHSIPVMGWGVGKKGHMVGGGGGGEA